MTYNDAYRYYKNCCIGSSIAAANNADIVITAYGLIAFWVLVD